LKLADLFGRNANAGQFSEARVDAISRFAGSHEAIHHCSGGVHPFGGRGLSGTGPKAGGPLYIHRLVAKAGVQLGPPSVPANEASLQFASWLEQKGSTEAAQAARYQAARSPLGFACELKGPVGEINLYALNPRGRVLIVPQTEAGLFCQLGAALATGNDVAIDANCALHASLENLPPVVADRVFWSEEWEAAGPFAAGLIEGDADLVESVNSRIAKLSGPIPIVQAATSQDIRSDADAYCLNWLVEEVSTSTNTTAAGGNASLMTLT
jgi:RHH-type proline utilization regulon transcriptional repressor/proline dehydrogenase/delta 1-pyrroline-5-carboxylate dehydrogenase